MKISLFIFFLTFSLSLFGQEKYIFDTAKIDGATKLIGRYPQFDKQKTYKEYNFIITDPQTIKEVIMKMPLCKEGENIIEDPEFRLNIIQHFDEVKTWTVNPKLKSVRYNGHTYEFDISILKTLAKKYPFDYKFDKIIFKSKTDYEQYSVKQKSDPTFLFDYAPQFKYEGSFEIQFPRNDRFSSPKAISDYLTPLIENIVQKKDYRVNYILNDKNRNDPTQFTMTIIGSRKLFDELQADGLKKEHWKETVEEGWFFYRTQ